MCTFADTTVKVLILCKSTSTINLPLSKRERASSTSAKTEFSASFLLWRQRQRHTNTDMGGPDTESADKVLSRSIKRHCAFSQVVTMVRLMLMYYFDFIAFMENFEKTWNDFLAKEMQKAPREPSLFD